MATVLPTNTPWPSEQPRPTLAPALTCTQCQMRVSSPIEAPSSMMAVGCALYGMDAEAQRMEIAEQCRDRRMTDVGHGLDDGARDVQAETVAVEDLPVALCVNLAEPIGELHLLAVDDNRAVAALAGQARRLRQIVRVDRQEPANARTREAYQTSRAVHAVHVHDALVNVAERPQEHVEEVQPDVGRDAAGLGQVPLPAG